MTTQTELLPEPQSQEINASPRWPTAKRISFRFTFAYLILYGTPFLLFPFAVLRWIGIYAIDKYLALWRPIIDWVGRHIFQVGYEITLKQIGSGDQTYHWIQVFCYLVLAIIAAILWSALDRKRTDYIRLHQWLTLFIRLLLGLLMITYGAQKAIPVQMPPPSLTRLLQPYGEFSPMTVLWSFMGSSPTYTSITGWIELSGGILLLFSRTTLLGAAVSFVAMTQVFLLDISYDVPVKLLAFHMMMMSVFLLAPHWRRLANVLVLNRRAEPAATRPVFQRRWLNRGLLIFEILLAVILVSANLLASYTIYTTYGGGAPRPPLYGIWTVEEFSVNGKVVPPLITDETRWQRVIIQNQNGLFIQPMNGSYQGYSLQLDLKNKTIILAKGGDQNKKASFTLEQPEPGQMKLIGEMDGNHLEAMLVRMDENQFQLRKPRFHWIHDD